VSSLVEWIESCEAPFRGGDARASKHRPQMNLLAYAVM
jgi:hypothetical protein